MINDYNYIPEFTYDVSNMLHHQALVKLNEAIEKNIDRKIIVMSHHMPSYDLIHPKFKNSNFNSAFASNVEIAKNPIIKVWLYGHTHIPCECDKYYCNPIGYDGENENIQYNKIFVLN
jgi:hypothetical protein